MTTTSLTAYRSLPITEVMQRVFEAIEMAGEHGLTCDEIADVTGIDYRTVTPRIVQLEGKGLVYRAGDTRKGKSNRGQLVVRVEKHKATIPMVRTVKKDGFMRGLIYAAKVLLKESDLENAKRQLGEVIRRKALTP